MAFLATFVAIPPNKTIRDIEGKAKGLGAKPARPNPPIVQKSAEIPEGQYGFNWGRPDVKAVWDAQVVPICFVIASMLYLRLSTQGDVFEAVVGLGIFLPPIQIFTYLVGIWTTHKPTLWKVSLAAMVIGLSMIGSWNLMMAGLNNELDNLELMRTAANPNGIWLAQLLILLGSGTILVMYMPFGIIAVLDLYGFEPVLKPNFVSGPNGGKEAERGEQFV